MLLAEAACLLITFILYISEVQGRANNICAFKGASVDLPCSVSHSTSSMKWYTVHRNGTKLDLCGDGNWTQYNTSEESNFTLTIKDLREGDANVYCCGNPGSGFSSRTEVQVADLQVKVIPATEGQTVTLMCSTSCPLTENPAAYIWYKNREFLYQDWSPWYQHLVSSEKAVTYSCAIKGYEHLRAPEVSVDSVTPTCFTVTYASHSPTDEPCSITYSKEVQLQMTPLDETNVRLTCTPSCPLIDPETAYKWYIDENIYSGSKHENLTVPSGYVERISCAVEGQEYLRTPKICASNICWIVNYVSKRICALRGTEVNISSEYSHPNNHNPLKLKCWYKIKRSGREDPEKLPEAAAHLEYHDNMKNQHILRIRNLKKNDSAEYVFRLQTNNKGWKGSDSTGVTLVVTDLRVEFTPSAVVTEGQRVTLTCSTSCPLTDNTNYIWFLNSRLLTRTENQNKHLVLDPVSSQHAGNYSCAVKTQEVLNSPENTLIVQAREKSMVIINALRLVVAFLIPVPLIVFHVWMRWIWSPSTSQPQP